jgi:hypothetical protein
MGILDGLRDETKYTYNKLFGSYNGWFLLAFIVLFTTALDVSTMKLSPAHFGELNPIFTFLGEGALWIISLIGTAIMLYLPVRFSKKYPGNKMLLFVYVSILLLLSLGHIVGAYSNIQATKLYLANPDGYTAMVASMSSGAKTASYLSTIIPLYIFLGFSIACHWIYTKLDEPLWEKKSLAK